MKQIRWFDRRFDFDKMFFRTALHPRLQQPMRLMDSFLFVAEYDDHHLARITEIVRSLKK